MNSLVRLWKDERGFLYTAEAVFMATILVIGLVSGWKSLNQSLSNELEDLANAFGNIDQSYSYGGTSGCCASTQGSDYSDVPSTYPVDNCTSASQVNEICGEVPEQSNP